MRIEIYQPERHRQLWDEFVAGRARNAHFMQTRRFLEYHGDRFDDHSLLVFGKAEEPLALLPANRSGDTLVSHGGIPFAGLLVFQRFRLSDWQEALLAIGQHLADTGIGTLDYRPTPPWYHAQPGEEDVYLLEQAGVQPELLASAICRMGGEFMGNANRRNEARASMVVDRDDGSLAELMHLVAETLRVRHEAKPVHSHDEITFLAGRFPGRIRAYTARSGGEMIAGVVLIISPQVVRLQYVGYSDGRAMSAVFAHLFTRREFCGRWFDFGTSMAGGAVVPGLFEYKESFAGRLAPVRRYRIPASSHPLI